MEIHETHFQEWHRLSIIPMVFKSGSTLLLTPMAFCAESRLRQPGGLAISPHPQASFQDDESSELANRLDIILYINPGIE